MAATGSRWVWMAAALAAACNGAGTVEEEPTAATTGVPADTTSDSGSPSLETSFDDSQGSTGGSDPTTTGGSSGGPGIECDDERATLQAIVDAYRTRHALLGGVASVGTDACPPWSFAWGDANVEEGVEMTVDDRLRAGSLTKTFTAALVLVLAQEGVLSLDDVVADHGIDLPDADIITVHQLLRHTSGLADYQDNQDFVDAIVADPDRIWEPDELVEHAVALGPVGEPGAGYAYANTNFVVAGQIVEAATNSSYGEALRSRVLGPLALSATFVEGERRGAAPTVTGYVIVGDDAPQDSTGFYDASQVWSAGNVVATADDSRAFVEALLTTELLEPSSLAAMLEYVPAGPGLRYGLGIFEVQGEGVVAVGHNGAVLGFQTAALYDEERGASVAVMHNQLAVHEDGALQQDPTALALLMLSAIELSDR